MPKWITNTTCHQLIGLKKLNTCHKNKIHLATHLIAYMQLIGAYSRSKYLKRQSNEKRTTKDYLDFYYIYYFMNILDWYMTITKMMSC